MAYSFRVRPHPLGVVVYCGANGRSELLIPNEDCCGVSFEKLKEIAATSQFVEVDDAAAANCPLRPKGAFRGHGHSCTTTMSTKSVENDVDISAQPSHGLHRAV